MAVAGLAVTGCTGEEYADAGRSAIVLQSADPLEFLGAYLDLRRRPRRLAALRRQGRATARRFRWSEILRRHLLPRIALVGGPAFATTRPARELPERSRGGRRPPTVAVRWRRAAHAASSPPPDPLARGRFRGLRGISRAPPAPPDPDRARPRGFSRGVRAGRLLDGWGQ
jgi:hypothetical protein